MCRNGQIIEKATEDIDKIEKILVRLGKKLSIVFKDGQAMDVSCDDVSSRHSLTPEMRERARQIAIKERMEQRERKCQM